MIIYNVTTNVDWSIHDDWLPWMKYTHIPEILATRLFHQFQVLRLLQVDEAEGLIYAVQFYSNSIESYSRYLDEFSGVFEQKRLERWGGHCLAFYTLMEVVH